MIVDNRSENDIRRMAMLIKTQLFVADNDKFNQCGTIEYDAAHEDHRLC